MAERIPVIVFVYNRLEHTKKTLKALSENTIANESELYIFSDGYKSDNDKKEVENVRRFIRDFKHEMLFKNITVIESETNRGLANSVITGVTDIIGRYGRVIVVEDDLVTSKDFLEFMNDALVYYENDQRVWSVTGYTPELPSLSSYSKDVYLGYRGATWGWGTWKDRWEMVDWNVSDYRKFRFNVKMQKKLKRGGMDLSSMLRAQMHGKLDSWAIRWMYQESKENKMTLFPKNARVVNIGFDGSGVHCKKEDDKRLFSMIRDEVVPYHFEDIQVNRELIKETYELNRLTLKIRIRDKFNEIKKKVKSS
jgi:hypothetical protein